MTTTTTTCTSLATMAVALAAMLLGLLLPPASAAAITTPDTTQPAPPQHTLHLSPSRRLSPHAGTGDAEDRGDDGAPVLVAVTTAVGHALDALNVYTPDTTATTAFAMPSHSCDLMYCDDGTSYCIYWGGYSSYDYTEHHPIPGETRTAIGTCRGLTTAGGPNSTITGGAPVVSTSAVG